MTPRIKESKLLKGYRFLRRGEKVSTGDKILYRVNKQMLYVDCTLVGYYNKNVGLIITKKNKSVQEPIVRNNSYINYLNEYMCDFNTTYLDSFYSQWINNNR